MIARLRKQLPYAQPLADVADCSEEWAPASITEHSAIIQLPDEAERIIAFQGPEKRAEYVRYSSNGQTTHLPTIARFYRRATIANGVVYANKSFETLVQSTGGKRISFSGTSENLSNQLLATNWVAEKYFGHWLRDGLGLELLAQTKKIDALGITREPWQHEAGYRDLVKLSLHRTALARIEGLWIVDDCPMNHGRIDRMRELRRRIRASAAPHTSPAPVFIRRDSGASRQLLNQDAIADALARRGFTIISPESETVASLVASLHNAPLVISVEGSALNHAVMAMADRGAMLLIQPPRRVTCLQKNNMEWTGLRMAHTVADDHGSGFTLSEDRLMRVCDLIART